MIDNIVKRKRKFITCGDRSCKNCTCIYGRTDNDKTLYEKENKVDTYLNHIEIMDNIKKKLPKKINKHCGIRNIPASFVSKR